MKNLPDKAHGDEDNKDHADEVGAMTTSKKKSGVVLETDRRNADDRDLRDDTVYIESVEGLVEVKAQDPRNLFIYVAGQRYEHVRETPEGNWV